MKDPEIAVLRLEELRELGVGVAVDDFGTGYSSLHTCVSFLSNSLKIDKSFVKNLGEPGEDTSVVAAMIALGHALGHRRRRRASRPPSRWRRCRTSAATRLRHNSLFASAAHARRGRSDRA